MSTLQGDFRIDLIRLAVPTFWEVNLPIASIYHDEFELTQTRPGRLPKARGHLNSQAEKPGAAIGTVGNQSNLAVTEQSQSFAARQAEIG